MRKNLLFERLIIFYLNFLNILNPNIILFFFGLWLNLYSLGFYCFLWGLLS